MKKVTILEHLYDDRWEFFQVVKGTPEEAIIHFFNMEYDCKDRPVTFRKGQDGWTYPVEVKTCDPNAAESVYKAGSYKCDGVDDERCRAREVDIWTPDLSPMKPSNNPCERCGKVQKGKLTFAIGANTESSWCVCQGSGKFVCPECFPAEQRECRRIINNL